MSNSTNQPTATDHNTPAPAPAYEPDAVEAIAFSAPMILPIVGGVLMFLLAFIAIYMA